MNPVITTNSNLRRDCAKSEIQDQILGRKASTASCGHCRSESGGQTPFGTSAVPRPWLQIYQNEIGLSLCVQFWILDRVAPIVRRQTWTPNREAPSNTRGAHAYVETYVT